MHSSIRSIGSLGLLAGVVAAANASGLAMGGSDDQTWVLNTGPDITYFTEPLSYVLPSSLTGSGSAGGTTTTNMPTSGGIYYNTNSYALVSNDGTAYVESGEGNDYFFTNTSSQAETVELQWQGFITSSSTAAGNGQAWDYAESYLLDGETNTYAYDLGYETASSTITTWNQMSSGTYTFTVAAGQSEYEIQSLAYNEADVYSPAATPEPGSFAVLGLGVLPLLGLRRKKHRSQG